jgi:FAD synthetase
MMRIVLTFGTFDYLHPGHKFYLRQAKKKWEYLIVVIARDLSVLTWKGELPDHDEQYRLERVRKTKIADLVTLGDENDKMRVVREYRPDVICLGYDQQADEQVLLQYCKAQGFTPEICRIEPYKPELHKSSIKKKQWRYDTPRYI